MKTIIYPVLLVAVLFSSAFTIILNNNWKHKEETYSVKFLSKKGKSFEGIFKGLKSEIRFDESNLSNSSIAASIDASSVNTGNGMRNKHAKQGLGADVYPTIKFESNSISKTASGFEAKGLLTIKDVTKEIVLPFTFKKTSAESGIFEGKFPLVPSDYHVDKMGTPDLIEVVLYVEVEK